MNLEEVTHQRSKNSRKRKLTPKENIVPRKKIILKHKLQSIQNSVAENAKEFKKCVRFDAITDTINSVEEAYNFETPPHSDEPEKIKKRKHIFFEGIVAEKKYSEDVDTPPMTADELLEKLRIRERSNTKSRLLLNLDRNKRYQEPVTVTRDWSYERRTYSHSQWSTASAEHSFKNSFLAQLHDESFEDPNQLNNAVESSAISMPTPEAEITAIPLNPAETHRVLDTEHFVIPVPSEPATKEIFAAMTTTNTQPTNMHDAFQSRPNLANYSTSIFSPYEKTSEIRVNREKIASYNRVNFKPPKPKLGIITCGLAVPNEEMKKTAEPPITFHSLVNSMMPKSARQNCQVNADKNVIPHADVNKSAKEYATENSPHGKKRGRPPKIKTEPTDVKGGKNLCMQSKNLKAKNVVMKKTIRSMLSKEIINKIKKPCKTKSVDNSTIECLEYISNHLPLNQGVDNISGIPYLTAYHNYIQPGITYANSVLEVQPAVNTNNVPEDIEVSTSNAENILQSISDEVERSSGNIQVENIDSTTKTIKHPVAPDSLNNFAEVAHSLPVDHDDATKKDFPESVDGNVQTEQTVSMIQAVKDVAPPDSLNISAELAHSIYMQDNDAAKKDYLQSVDSVQNLAQVEKMDTCTNSTNQADKSSVDDSVRSTEKRAQRNQESVKSLTETMQNNQYSALDTTFASEIAVDKTLDQNIQSLAAREKQSAKIVTEQLKDTQNASCETPDLSADKYIQPSLMEIFFFMTELSPPTLVRENESSQDASIKSIEEQEQSVTKEKESSASSQNIENSLPDVPVKRGRGRPRKSTNKTSPTVSDQNTNKASPTISGHNKLKKDKTVKSLFITDSKDNQTDANKSTNEKLDVDSNDSTPVCKSQRIKKRKVMGDEIFERALAVSKQKEKVTPKQKGEVISEREGEVSPKQKGKVIHKQKGEVTPSTPESKSKRRGRPRKYPAKDSPSVLLSPADNMNGEVQKSVNIGPEPVDENQRKYFRKGRPRKCLRYADLNSGVDSLDESSCPNARKDKSDLLRGKNTKDVDKSGNVDEDVKGITESVNEQKEEIVLPLEKRKQRQSRKNDDREVENADQFTAREKKSEQDDNDAVEENSVISRSLWSQNENDSSSDKLVTSIISKLKENSPLSGDERSSLLEWLKRDSLPYDFKKRNVDDDVALKKRKLDENICSCQRHEKANKERVQTPILRTVKDGFTQTDGLNYTEKEVNATELIDEMKKLAVGQTLDDNLTSHLMNLTFDVRRNFILLKAPSVFLIKYKYPLLFTAKNEVKNELDRIFYAGKCEEFLKNMEDYSKVILRHCKENDEIRVLTEKRMKSARTHVQKAYAEVVGSVFALSKLLDEEFKFIHLLNYPLGSDDVYPHIDASNYSLKDLFFDNITFNIIVEEMLLCEASNFFEAILCLVSSFYIFNIDYPESCKRTLTCFEKMYLCANETDVDETTSKLIELLSSQVKGYRYA